MYGVLIRIHGKELVLLQGQRDQLEPLEQPGQRDQPDQLELLEELQH